jgi:uncharacterized Zn finger protein (UPF0148 family)
MKKDEDNDYAVNAGKKEEEMHCTRCGTYLGAYGPGSNGTIPCPKCKEPNLIDFTGEDFIVRRRKRALKT